MVFNIKYYDLRSKQPPIKDQGQRNTCVAFAATAGHEYLRGNNIDLSEEFLNWGCKKIDGVVNDQGTYLNSAILALLNFGQSSEIYWPYQNIFIPRLYNPSTKAIEDSHNYKIQEGNRIDIDIFKVKEKLQENFAVIVGLYLFKEFFIPSDGVIEYPTDLSNNYGGHAVLIVGWEEHEDGNYFIIRNSWGESWGKGGYAFLSYEYFINFAVDACIFKL